MKKIVFTSAIASSVLLFLNLYFISSILTVLDIDREHYIHTELFTYLLVYLLVALMLLALIASVCFFTEQTDKKRTESMLLALYFTCGAFLTNTLMFFTLKAYTSEYIFNGILFILFTTCTLSFGTKLADKALSIFSLNR